MSEEGFESLAGAPEGEIELAQVERELAAVWAQAAPKDPSAEPAVLRARSLNLLVLGRDAAALDQVRPIAAGTTLAHPSRILLLAPESGAPGTHRDGQDRQGGKGRPSPSDYPVDPVHPCELSPTPRRLNVGARISTFCHRVGGGGRHVCCEEITVITRGAASGRIREAALPLLVPDLPVHLWLPGTDGHDPATIERLVDLADEVIWSARKAEEELPPTPRRSRPPAYVDLDWMRLRPWCELTAQLFDAPDRRSDLKRIKLAEVTVAGPPADRPGAGWLWAGWLASRLGWTCDGAALSQEERRMSGPLGPITVRVIHQAPGQPVASGSLRRHGNTENTEAAEQLEVVPQGELLSVRLHLHGWTVPLTLDRCPSRDREDLCISAGGVRTIHLGNRDEAALLGEALAGAARDPFYEAAWEMAVGLWSG